VNIFLVPYTWMRHLHVALLGAGAGLLAWWLVLTASMYVGWWSSAADGTMFLGTLAAATAGMSVLAETSLRRDALWRRLLLPSVAAALAAGLTVMWFTLFTWVVGPMLFPDAVGAELSDASLVTLKYRLLPFVFAGVSTASATITVRRFAGFLTQLTAGVVAGLFAAAAWYVWGYARFDALGWSHLYYSSAIAAAVFGGLYGLGAWGIPDDLYVGWLRVVSQVRHARRVPIDGPVGATRERFVGHYPRGLDLFLPAENGVLELHVSVLVNRRQEYRARGLTLAPTEVRRFLETVDLRYDARRPAPLETRLHSGDRIVLGSGRERVVIEFLMLPREER
jgi:hypothetical protein